MSGATATSKAPRLPRLPVPPLRETLDRYLKSLEPLLLEDEARGGPPFEDAMHKRIAWAEEFERGLGKSCQERLIELDKKSPNNWLDDNFWLDKAYLEWRAPLLINSNWWLVYEHDSTVPASVLNGGNQENTTRITLWQIRRASWLLHRSLEFKERLESQELYPNTTRTGLWMRNTVPRMFNVCRVPQPKRDRLTTPRASSPFHKKIVVMLHDWMYALDVYDGAELHNHKILEQGLRGVVEDARSRLALGDRAVPVSILTADDRDIWAKNQEYLRKLSPINQRTLTAIEDSIMIVSLDDYVYQTTDPHPSELKSHLHNIRSGKHAHNRWFDKGITLIVERNARAGMMGEHSPVDALVPSIVADYSLAEDTDPEWGVEDLDSHQNDGSHDTMPSWERLNWVADDFIRQECIDAEDRAKRVIEDSDDDVLQFTEYGSDWLKNTAGTSPDAYIQMAMQLAWYRLRGSFTATYETALTRLFHHGRTETIRTLSADSRKFVLAMTNPEIPAPTRYDLLRQAIKTHMGLTKAAATGKGIDRHLLGLRLVMGPEEPCSLFDDHLFARSQEWKLSTSGLSAGMYFRGTGFGAAYNDGYGINYLAGPNKIKFGIESKFSCEETSTESFKQAISASLMDMKGVVDSQSHISVSDVAYKPRL